MGNNKNKTVLNQTLFHIAIILLVICILFITVLYKYMKHEMDDLLYSQILQTAEVTKSAINASVSSKETIEQLIDERLFTISKQIAEDLRGKTIEEISQEELVRIKEKYELNGISLFVHEENDIVVAKSSESNEIGLSTKGWGYWYTAFEQLMSGNEVKVEDGYYRKNYWAGPIAISNTEQNY